VRPQHIGLPQPLHWVMSWWCRGMILHLTLNLHITQFISPS
jgi:hypothetical protein